MRTVISSAIIYDDKLLIVRKKQTWILPGGKPEQNESDISCLIREVSEELSGTKLENISYYRGFEGRTPHKGDVVQVRVYFAKIKGDLYLPSAEICEYAWFNDSKKYVLSDITSKIVDALIFDKYLKNSNNLD